MTQVLDVGQYTNTSQQESRVSEPPPRGIKETSPYADYDAVPSGRLEPVASSPPRNEPPRVPPAGQEADSVSGVGLIISNDLNPDPVSRSALPEVCLLYTSRCV